MSTISEPFVSDYGAQGRCNSLPTDRASAVGNRFWALLDRSDDALLDFDTAMLENEDIEHARCLLREQHDLYSNHLAIAKFIDGWIQRLLDDAVLTEFNHGFVYALIEIRTHLRDGDLLDQSTSG